MGRVKGKSLAAKCHDFLDGKTLISQHKPVPKIAETPNAAQAENRPKVGACAPP